MTTPTSRRPIFAGCPAFTILFASFVLSWAGQAGAAPKTDTVIFVNGDKLTGEVKSMSRGRLHLNTDATGTISIEWPSVAGIVSNQKVQVEMGSGVRYFGNLAMSADDPGIVVVTSSGPQKLDSARVVQMTPIETKGLSALNMDVSLGYNFAKAGGVETGNFAINADYRSRIRIESIKASTTLSNSDTQEASNRSNFGLQHTRLWSRRWFSNANLTLDKNDELGLELRTAIGGGGGRYLLQSNHSLLSLEGGLQVARENQTALVEDVDSVEATITFKWDWFRFDAPELDWSTTVQLIPSLTESGRVRGELDTSLQWELIGDLNWGVSIYGSFDNQAKDETGESTDFGINTSLIYKF